MKSPFFFASLVLWIGATGIASAATTLIDDFTVSSATISGSGYRAAAVNIGPYGGAIREIETPSGLEHGETNVIVEVFGSMRVSGSSGVSLDYRNFDIDVSGQNFLRLDFNLVQNLDWVAIELMTDEGPIRTIVAISDEAGGPVVPHYFDLRSFSGYSATALAILTGVGFDFYSNDENYDFNLTNVSITSVPEPSTYALMGLGMAGLLGLSFSRFFPRSSV